MDSSTRVALREPRVHETAIVDRSARLADDVVVGPYSIIGPDVELGPGCRVDSHVRLDGPLVAGANNRIFHGAALGAIPQDLKFAGARSGVRIGDGNVFREFVTVNRATAEGAVTQIGNRILFMAYVHVAHDCIVRDDAILANSVNLAGHVEVDEHAVVGGVTAVHQFVHIGAYSIIGGESKVTKDMPPFFKAAGNPLRVVGPNVVGLDRNGFSIEVRRVVKEAFRLLYRSDLNVTQAIERIRQDLPPIPEIRRLLEFIKRSRRGITR